MQGGIERSEMASFDQHDGVPAHSAEARTTLRTYRHATEPSRSARSPLIRPRFARPPSPARGEGFASRDLALTNCFRYREEFSSFRLLISPLPNSRALIFVLESDLHLRPRRVRKTYGRLYLRLPSGAAISPQAVRSRSMDGDARRRRQLDRTFRR